MASANSYLFQGSKCSGSSQRLPIPTSTYVIDLTDDSEFVGTSLRESFYTYAAESHNGFFSDD
jgi:hypothetical protein